MREFVIAIIVDDYEIGKLFTIWPLHITLLPPFNMLSVDDILGRLTPITKSTQPIKAEVGGSKIMGEARTARLITPNSNLADLHSKILQAIELKSLAVSGRHTGEQYIPHISRTKSGRDFESDKIEIGKIQIVESLPQGYRKVLAELRLGAL